MLFGTIKQCNILNKFCKQIDFKHKPYLVCTKSGKNRFVHYNKFKMLDMSVE